MTFLVRFMSFQELDSL